MEAEPPGVHFQAEPGNEGTRGERINTNTLVPGSDSLRCGMGTAEPKSRTGVRRSVSLPGSAWECRVQGSALPVWGAVAQVMVFSGCGGFNHGGGASGAHSQTSFQGVFA